MTESELSQIEERAERATRGLWVRKEYEDVGYGCRSWIDPIERMPDGHRYTSDQGILNQEFMAHSRQDVPALCAEIRRLQRLVEWYINKTERL